jgi:hypothetical protein
MDKFIIESIEPFNDILYKSCFYNAYFSILRHHNISVLPVLANDVIVYRYDKEKGLNLSWEFIHNEDIERLSDSVGIGIEKKVECEDPVNDVIDAIMLKKPVIVSIDSYYEPFRSDTYKKKHWPHSLLIYGYDDNEQLFHIIEHKNLENLAYERQTIDYIDFANAYYGYKTNFNHLDILKMDTGRDFKDLNHGEENATYFAFYAKGNGCQDDNKEKSRYVSMFARNVLTRKEIIEDGLKCLPLFAEEFEKNTLEEQLLSQAVQVLAPTLNNIINVKLVEKYRVNMLLGSEPELLGLIDRIIENWSRIRAGVVKYFYSMKYNQKSFENANEILKETVKLEEEFYNSLFSFAERSQAL